MKRVCRFTPDDSMSSLVGNHYDILQVMSRFGIRVGFGDKSLREVCEGAGVDCETFLAVVEFVLDGFNTKHDSYDISVESLLQYLRQSHQYFLEFYLPMIRRKLLDGIEMRSGDVSFLILKFFDEYSREVRTHMEYEENTVFEYVASLLEGKSPGNYSISTYSDHHGEVSSKMRELKNLILKYCPDGTDVNLLNAALYDIYRCEQELESHCMIEDSIFVPAIEKLEKSVRRGGE